MLAAWYERPGPAAEVLEIGEMPDPSPGPGDVRVQVTMSGINPGDTNSRPRVAREVTAAGDMRPDRRVGDALEAAREGAMRDHVLVEAQLAPGRIARNSSASARFWSPTEHSTSDATPASKDPSPAGSLLATPSVTSTAAAALAAARLAAPRRIASG